MRFFCSTQHHMHTFFLFDSTQYAYIFSVQLHTYAYILSVQLPTICKHFFVQLHTICIHFFGSTPHHMHTFFLFNSTPYAYIFLFNSTPYAYIFLFNSTPYAYIFSIHLHTICIHFFLFNSTPYAYISSVQLHTICIHSVCTIMSFMFWTKSATSWNFLPFVTYIWLKYRCMWRKTKKKSQFVSYNLALPKASHRRITNEMLKYFGILGIFTASLHKAWLIHKTSRCHRFGRIVYYYLLWFYIGHA